MSRFADVRAIEVVPVLAVALQKFGEEAATALTDLELEVNRAIQWISCDLKEYWTQQVRKAQQQVAEARINLERKQMFRIAEERASCIEEKKALEAAKRRLHLCQQKLQAVRRWSQALARQFMEYKGRVAALSGWLQTDLPKGVAVLKNMAGALETYVQVDAEASAAPPAENSTAPAEGEADKGREPTS
jgi:exonuclease VII large subunit